MHYYAQPKENWLKRAGYEPSTFGPTDSQGCQEKETPGLLKLRIGNLKFYAIYKNRLWKFLCPTTFFIRRAGYFTAARFFYLLDFM